MQSSRRPLNNSVLPMQAEPVGVLPPVPLSTGSDARPLLMNDETPSMVVSPARTRRLAPPQPLSCTARRLHPPEPTDLYRK